MSTTRNTKEDLEALAQDLERFDFTGHMSLSGRQYWAFREREDALEKRATSLGDMGLHLFRSKKMKDNQKLPRIAW